MLRLGYIIVKIERGSGWHPDDGGCLSCGAPQGVLCKKDCKGLTGLV